MENHALTRFLERFPEHKADRSLDFVIEAEVRRALNDWRVSASKPPGIAPPDDPKSIYVWTEDGERVYALLHGKTHFAVMTTMRADL